MSDHPQPLLHHLLELRRRLIWVVLGFMGAFAVCYSFSGEIFGFLIKPLATIFEGQTGRRLIYTGLAEAFLTYLKVAFFGALFITMPLFAMQIWLFVAPGLYAMEKKALRPFLMATPICFFLGAAFAYQIIIPNAWKFFLAFETSSPTTDIPIQLEARVSEYLSIVMQLIMAFGCSFLLPVVLVLLGRVDVVKAHTLAKGRRYALLLIMIVAAVITPPDVLSMLGLALPLYLLYELSIFLVKIAEKRDAHVGHKVDSRQP